MGNGDSLSNLAYHYLADKIMRNELLPGEIINRRDVAAALGISVAPVLEAMLLLENEGLLETLPRRGTRVSIVLDEDITGFLFLRDALESTAARYFCGQPLRDAMDELLPMAQRLDGTSAHSNEYFRLDREFHKALVALCRSEAFCAEHDRVTKLSLFHNINRLVAMGGLPKRKSHTELLRQLCEAAPQEASEIMHEHIIAGKGRLVYTNP